MGLTERFKHRPPIVRSIHNLAYAVPSFGITILTIASLIYDCSFPLKTCGLICL